MITRQQIIRRADEDGVGAPAVERDYVLSHVLGAIAASPTSARFVFKGGTALRMCYFDEYRYSADIDLSLVRGFSKAEARDAIGAALADAARQRGFPLLSVGPDAGAMIEYEGPLGRVRRIKLDLDDDELLFPASRRPLIRRYPDVEASEGLPTYGLIEIAAEKMRCVIQRLQCRDLYDLHQLLEGRSVDAGEAWAMFEEKARHKNIDPCRFFERFDARAAQYEERWVGEMSEHVPGDVPPFEATLRQLRRRLRALRR